MLLFLRCVESSNPSQVSLYLEEPSTCSYVLTVEGSFICKLLETTDEHGLFHYPPPPDDGGLYDDGGASEDGDHNRNEDPGMSTQSDEQQREAG